MEEEIRFVIQTTVHIHEQRAISQLSASGVATPTKKAQWRNEAQLEVHARRLFLSLVEQAQTTLEVLKKHSMHEYHELTVQVELEHARISWNSLKPKHYFFI